MVEKSEEFKSIDIPFARNSAIVPLILNTRFNLKIYNSVRRNSSLEQMTFFQVGIKNKCDADIQGY
jgi:hypothetical protein